MMYRSVLVACLVCSMFSHPGIADERNPIDREITIRILIPDAEGATAYWEVVQLAIYAGGPPTVQLARLPVEVGESEISVTVPDGTKSIFLDYGANSLNVDFSQFEEVVGSKQNWSYLQIPLCEDKEEYHCEILLKPTVTLTGRVLWWDGGSVGGSIHHGEKQVWPAFFSGGPRSRFELRVPESEASQFFVRISRANWLRPPDEARSVITQFPYEVTAEQAAASGEVGDLVLAEVGEPSGVLSYSVKSRQVGIGPQSFPVSLHRVALVSLENGIVWESSVPDHVAKAMYTRTEPDDPGGIFEHTGEVFAPPGEYYAVPLFGGDINVVSPVYDAIRTHRADVLKRLSKVTLVDEKPARVEWDAGEISSFVDVQRMLLDERYGVRQVPMIGEVTILQAPND